MKRLLFLIVFFTITFQMNIFEVDTPASSDFTVPLFNGDLYLDDVYLGVYTYSQAYDMFNADMLKRKENFILKVIVDDKKYDITAKDIHWDGDTIDILMMLMDISSEKPPGTDEARYYTNFTYNEKSLDNIINRIYFKTTGNSDISGVLGFNFETKQFVFNTNATGLSIDKELLKELLKGAIESRNQSDDENQTLIFLELESDPDAMTVERLNDEYGLLSSYTTYTNDIPNRNNNIRIAGDSVDRTILLPDEIFSFLKTIGRTSADRGYMVAGILVNGKPAQGMAGGICQVSSTIYNTVLDAGLDVVERHPHSAPVDYVPQNRDATVNTPNLDFRFRNNTKSNLYITVDYDNKALTVSLYGKKY